MELWGVLQFGKEEDERIRLEMAVCGGRRKSKCCSAYGGSLVLFLSMSPQLFYRKLFIYSFVGIQGPQYGHNVYAYTDELPRHISWLNS